ncbi:hypothetical protein [Flavobacterium sp.]|uniref:hypothetical protein n=1 Tax=Flavobacterium sp. TaxID=239 RepID=UPI00286C0323|nr:hypothetical protein [Flavobacterium sp.]
MKKIYLLLFSLLFTFYSCDKTSSAYYKVYDNFESNRWQKPDKKEFAFSITDEAAYDVTLKFSHVSDYQFDSVPMLVLIVDPDGKEEKFPIDLKIKDASGKQLAECAGDVCDLNYNIKKNVNLPKGDYKVTVSHNFNGPYLPNILGIGLDVKQSK